MSSLAIGHSSRPRRGRPPGAIDPAAANAKIGLEQFAALRAWLSGLDAPDACRRFLSTLPPPSNEAAALRRLLGLLESVVDTARHRPGEVDQQREALRACAVLEQALLAGRGRRQELLARESLARLRRKQAVEPAAAPHPAPTLVSAAHLASLEAFQAHYIEQAGHDPDLSEAEWLELLEEAQEESEQSPPASAPLSALTHAGLAEERGKASALPSPAESLAALDACRWIVQRRPKASDLVDTWFTGPTRKRLVEAGLMTLFAVADLITVRGRRWWTKVPGLGPVRAQRVVDWLAALGADEPSLRLRADIFAPADSSPALPASKDRSTVEHQLQPLQNLVEAKALDGSAGFFRVPQENLLGARNDVEAIRTALAKYEDQPLTLAVYSREILRFTLWCHVEKRKPVSSITVADAREFKRFLDAIPMHWINPANPRRGNPGWRPFRGQLDEATKRKALTSIHVILDQLHHTGYLTGNPMSGLVKRSTLKRPSMAVERSFNEAQWEHISRELDARAEAGTDPEAAKARRLRALVKLLHSTGIRRQECFTASRDDLLTTVVDGQPYALLRVLGMGQKLREVYVPDGALRSLEAHWADVENIADRTTAPRGLICALSAPVNPVAKKRSDALTPDGMYKILKRFFRDCARTASKSGLREAEFMSASAHWLRHTFGMTMTPRTDLRTVQRAMGHSNINTTAVYSRQHRNEMLSELQQAMPLAMRN